jgi:hypothetical protein
MTQTDGDVNSIEIKLTFRYIFCDCKINSHQHNQYILQNKKVQLVAKKKTGNENFPNVKLVSPFVN